MRTRLLAALLVFASTLWGVGASAARPPGGANQASAMAGKVGQTLWNGEIRLKITSVRAETADEAKDLAPSPDKKVIRVEGIIRNGTSSTLTERPGYALADADAVTVVAGPLDLEAATMAQGAAAKQTIRIVVPADFHPAKLIVTPAWGKPFRITLPSSH